MMHHTGNAMDYIGIVGQIPTLDEYLRIKGFGHILRKFRPTGPLMRFTASQIRAHKLTPDSTRPDFLTRFIAAKEKYPDVMTDNQLATYTNTNISAGSDTTAIALREVIYRLLMHPRCHAQFMAELKAVLQARGPSSDRASPITWAETQRSMPYFQAVIKECLRIHPPLGQLIPREVPDGGTTLCGRFIPGGTVVGCNAWTLHRSRALYGPDADEFRPERWIVDDEDAEGVERVRNMENLNFAFGGGPRVCIGKNIAMLEICKVVPEFFRRFTIQMVDSGRYYLRPGWLVLQEGLDVFLKLRDPGELEGSFEEK
jgi:cytochrome P450